MYADRSAELAKTPIECSELYNEAFAAGDIDRLMEYYLCDAVLVLEPGKPVSTPAAIREAMLGYMSYKLPIVSTIRYVYEAGDTAIIIADWTIDGDDPDGKTVHLSGAGTDVLRRGADGGWRYSIDNPFGSARGADDF